MKNENYLHFTMDGETADYDMHGDKKYLLEGTILLIGGAIHTLRTNGVIIDDEVDGILAFARKACEKFAAEVIDASRG